MAASKEKKAEQQKQQQQPPKLRNRKGTRQEDWNKFIDPATNKPLPIPPLSEMDSPFPLQQHLQLHIDSLSDLITPPPEYSENSDSKVFIYEHVRLLCVGLNQLICKLLDTDGLLEGMEGEEGKCQCEEMRAGEICVFYCAALHAKPNNCSAIDYSIHTLDHSIAMLTNSKSFPSRLTIPDPSYKHLTNMIRRLYRILAHAFYHHKSLFMEFEAETRLFERVVKLSKEFELIPEDQLVVPEREVFMDEEVEGESEGEGDMDDGDAKDEQVSSGEDSNGSSSDDY